MAAWRHDNHHDYREFANFNADDRLCLWRQRPRVSLRRSSTGLWLHSESRPTAQLSRLDPAVHAHLGIGKHCDSTLQFMKLTVIKYFKTIGWLVGWE